VCVCVLSNFSTPTTTPVLNSQNTKEEMRDEVCANAIPKSLRVMSRQLFHIFLCLAKRRPYPFLIKTRRVSAKSHHPSSFLTSKRPGSTEAPTTFPSVCYLAASGEESPRSSLGAEIVPCWLPSFSAWITPNADS